MKTSTAITSQVQTARDAVDAATLAAIPAAPTPGASGGGWAYVGGMRLANGHAPDKLHAIVRNDGTANLTAGRWLGWNAAEEIAEEFDLLKAGGTVALTADSSFGQVLSHVPARYTHVTLIATASAGDTTVKVQPIEELDS
jgi:hypothetical protein